MANDLSNPDKSALIQTGKLATVGGAAIALIFVQMTAFNFIMDAVMSGFVFGAGYLAGRIRRK